MAGSEIPRPRRPFDGTGCRYDLSEDTAPAVQCPNPAHPDSESGLCVEHLRAAAAAYDRWTGTGLAALERLANGEAR